MALIITLAHEKGGVSKTTLALNLQGYFRRSGHSCIVVDGDPQGSTTELFKAFGSQPGWNEVSFLSRKEYRNFEELPGKLSGHDIALIDTPPYFSSELAHALAISHLVLVPCKASLVDFLAINKTLDILDLECRKRPALRVAVVLTQTIAGTDFAQTIRKHLEKYGFPILKAELGNRVCFARAWMNGPSVFEGTGNPKAQADIEAIGSELIDLLANP